MLPLPCGRVIPLWHAGSRSGAVLLAQTAIRFLYLLRLPYGQFYTGSSSTDRW